MTRFLSSDLLHWRRKGSKLILAFSWLLGLICGILVCLSAGNSFASWMRSTVYGAVSIVSLLFVTILPFLFSALAVYLSKPVLLLVICFCKAFLLSYVSLGVYQAFGSAGWLVRYLLSFSECMSAPLLYWCWQRYLLGKASLFGWESAYAFALAVLIGSADYCIISPFLASLIDF